VRGRIDLITSHMTSASTTRVGKAQTVLGLVAPESLGVTMPHEHVLVDLSCMFDPPTEASERRRAHSPFSLENLDWIRTHYFRHRENLLVDDEDTAAAELRLFKAAGGSTIVDVTPPGIGRDPLGLARVARVSGVNIVMATGFYVASTHPAEVAGMTAADVARRMIDEIRDGAVLTPASAGDQDWSPQPTRTGVKAGIIKTACSYPLEESERKVLAGAAAAQRATGAGITVHVGRHEHSALEIIDALREAQADLTRCSLDHLDLRVERRETLLKIADSGCMLEFDMFGHESSYYPLTSRDMPSDAQRLDVIADLVAEGLAERILVSHDICTRHRLVRYGGHGYGRIPGHIVPRMRDRGWREEDIELLVAVNPARLLTFAEEQGG
jgi:phosphotriesterase-related protein